ncbi:hypothetical protein STEG23_018976 [Scotinomys teguina]
MAKERGELRGDYRDAARTPNLGSRSAGREGPHFPTLPWLCEGVGSRSSAPAAYSGRRNAELLSDGSLLVNRRWGLKDTRSHHMAFSQFQFGTPNGPASVPPVLELETIAITPELQLLLSQSQALGGVCTKTWIESPARSLKGAGAVGCHILVLRPISLRVIHSALSQQELQQYCVGAPYGQSLP